MIDHDVKPGRLQHCQICGSHDLELVIDCGHQALCDSLLRPDDLHRSERSYPARLMRCPRCANAQLDYVVAGEEVYHSEYPYRSGITKELREYQQALSADLIARLGLSPGAVVVDIGSNDGTLLEGFRANGMRVLGVEPTKIARFAQEAGIETIQSFFTEGVARAIVKDCGHAALVTATNVFAHIASLGEVMRGITALIGDHGVFVLENHYLRDVIERNQYDTIYHEHVRTYCLNSLVTLFDQYGMEVFHAARVTRYGGNIRAFVARKGRYPVDPSVGQILSDERAVGLFDPEPYAGFRRRVEKTRDDLLGLLVGAKQRGQSVAGKSCPGRCVPLLTYTGVGRHLMPYIAEQPTSLKLGMYVPGVHIPIVEDAVLLRDQPDYVGTARVALRPSHWALAAGHGAQVEARDASTGRHGVGRSRAGLKALNPWR